MRFDRGIPSAASLRFRFRELSEPAWDRLASLSSRVRGLESSPDLWSRERNFRRVMMRAYEQTVFFCEIDSAAGYVSDGYDGAGEVVDAGACAVYPGKVYGG